MKTELKPLPKSGDLASRTKLFALRIISFYESLPSSYAAQLIGKQLLRSSTSVGAQYREARRARSREEFQAKLGCILQELDETGYWLELIMESGIVSTEKVQSLYQEQQELEAIVAAARITIKKSS